MLISVGERSQATAILEDVAMVESFAHTGQLSIITGVLGPEEGFAMPLSLSHGLESLGSLT